MVIVFILISIVMIIIGGILLSRDTAIAEESTLGQVLTVVGYIFLILSILTGAILGFVLANRMIVDDTILLYSEENKKIEEQVAEIVDGYLEYEQETVQNIKPESAIVIAQTYPALLSNTLVQRQIDLYINNNSEIKQLEKEKLSYRIVAFWLYFGK